MNVATLLEQTGLTHTLYGNLEASVEDLVCDSRAVRHGAGFVAIRGHHVDGHDYIDSALSKGASFIVAETEPPDVLPNEVAWARLEKTDSVLGVIAGTFYGQPSRDIDVLAVTGTNGKTTVSWLVESILKHAGKRCGLIGTIETHIDGAVEPAVFTTPFGDDLQRLLAKMRDAGCTHAVLEASSHGLKQDRIAGVRIASGGFTNLSRDHLDFHLTVEDYRDSKAKLFRQYAEQGVFNIDDTVGRGLWEEFKGHRLAISASGDAAADIRVTAVNFDLTGCQATLETPEGVQELTLPLVGEHNLENALVALGMTHLVGVSLSLGCQGLSQNAYVPGRLERVKGPRHVLVDYAHSPDALKNVIQALQRLVPGRVICVFGAGGNRDRGKRPDMGRTVEAFADVVIVTSDNPRTEAPQAIADEICAGMRQPETCTVELDRRRAIRHAVALAEPEDLVLIAGKGHETYQVLGTEHLPFDDRQVAAEAMTWAEQGGRA